MGPIVRDYRRFVSLKCNESRPGSCSFMNCWEILGIEPTGDRRKIQDAYEQQLKFASEDEAKSLEAAFREAVGDDPGPVKQASDTVQTEPHREVQDEEPDRPLDANEGQVVREVVIQIKALLNDSSRSKDPGIWKAILDEPPADQPRLRREIGIGRAHV